MMTGLTCCGMRLVPSRSRSYFNIQYSKWLFCKKVASNRYCDRAQPHFCSILLFLFYRLVGAVRKRWEMWAQEIPETTYEPEVEEDARRKRERRVVQEGTALWKRRKEELQRQKHREQREVCVINGRSLT